MTIKSGHGLIIGLVLMVVAMVGHMVTQPSEMTGEARATGDCVVLVWGDLVNQTGSETEAQGVWDSYMAAGWYGDARDHMEALWSPECTDEYVGNLISEYQL